MAQELSAVLLGLIGAMQTKLVDYDNLVKCKKSMTICINLLKRSIQRLYLQFSDEFTNQLTFSQLEVVLETELLDGILKLLNERISSVN